MKESKAERLERWRRQRAEMERRAAEYYGRRKQEPKLLDRAEVIREALATMSPENKRRIHDLHIEARNRRVAPDWTQYEVDHIVPLSRGGKHHPDNMRVITADHNRRKGWRFAEVPARRAAAPSPAAPSIFD